MAGHQARQAAVCRQAAAEQGTLRGQVSFMSYDGKIYRILGYTPAGRFSAYQGAFDAAIRSFRRLSDPRYLDVQPKRIALVNLGSQMDLPQFARAYPSTVKIETIGLINGVHANQMLPRGELAKRVVGGRLPAEARSGPRHLERLAGLGIAAGMMTPRSEARPAGPRRPRVLAPARPGYWSC